MTDTLRFALAVAGLIGGLSGIVGAVLVYRFNREDRQAGSRTHREDPS